MDQSGFDDTDANDCDPLFGCLIPVETVPGIDFDMMIASQIANALAAAAAELAQSLSNIPTCWDEIQIWYRPVDVPAAKAVGATHSFLEISSSSGTLLLNPA